MRSNTKFFRRSLGVMTNITIALLLVYALFTLADLAMGWGEHQILTRIAAGERVSASEVNTSDLARTGLAGLQSLVLVLCAVAVALWTYHANAESTRLGAYNLKFSPGTAVVWYFIPIAYLWMPYRAMKEIWQSSHTPVDWQSEQVSPTLTLWWVAWVIHIGAARVARRLFASGDTLQSFFWVNRTEQIGDAAGLVAALLLVSIVSSVNEVQRRRFDDAQRAEAHQTLTGTYSSAGA